MRLKNKVAIITGSTRGIGFAVADAFIKEGAKVAICGSRLENAENAIAKLKETYPKAKLLPIGVSVTDTDSVDQMIETVMKEWGRIDILVNNAGITNAKPTTEMTDEEFDSVIAIDLAGPFKCTRAVAKVMKEQKYGAIVNTSSMVGLYGSPCQASYASAKAGVIGLTKSCAKELGRFGIRVNAVAPGVVLTDMVAASVDERMMAGLQQLTPLGRAANPEELAPAYVYLASDDASFTTGAILSVDGGIVM